MTKKTKKQTNKFTKTTKIQKKLQNTHTTTTTTTTTTTHQNNNNNGVAQAKYFTDSKDESHPGQLRSSNLFI
jgi:hypothetical protein